MDVFCVVIWPLLCAQESWVSFILDESPIPKALFQLNHLFRDLVSKYSLILLFRGKNFNVLILRVYSLAPSSMVTHDPY